VKPEMRIQLLGRFLIPLADAEERLIPVPSRRRRALLAYLAMQPEFFETRERLATLLWGDVPDRQVFVRPWWRCAPISRRLTSTRCASSVTSSASSRI
jgi:hypothetical protein